MKRSIVEELSNRDGWLKKTVMDLPGPTIAPKGDGVSTRLPPNSRASGHSRAERRLMKNGAVRKGHALRAGSTSPESIGGRPHRRAVRRSALPSPTRELEKTFERFQPCAADRAPRSRGRGCRKDRWPVGALHAPDSLLATPLPGAPSGAPGSFAPPAERGAWSSLSAPARAGRRGPPGGKGGP